MEAYFVEVRSYIKTCVLNFNNGRAQMINALIFKHLNLNEKKGHSKFIVKLVLKACL